MSSSDVARARRPASVSVVVTLACVLALLSASVDTATAQAAQAPFAARANAICASARAQVRQLAPLYPIGRTARIGDRWLTINRTALAKLRALKLPASGRAQARQFVAAADKMVNSGLVAFVKAAKSRRQAAYVTADKRLTQLIWNMHVAANRSGLGNCFRW